MFASAHFPFQLSFTVSKSVANIWCQVDLSTVSGVRFQEGLGSRAVHWCCQLFSLVPKGVASIRADNSLDRLLNTNQWKPNEERSATPSTLRSNFFR
jgi:hypothetical protein